MKHLMRRPFKPATLLFAFALLFMACSGPQGTATASAPGDGVFSEQVLPVLQEKFTPLLAKEPGLELDSWESLIAGSENGQVLIPFDAEGSLLIQLATKLDDADPLRPHADALTAEEIALVRQWIDDGARNDDGVVPYADATQLLYACNQGAAKVSVIDMETNVIIRTVDLQALGFTKDSRPHHTAVEPDGSFWYVSLIGDDKVLKFNRNNELVAQVDFERPGMLALHPDQDVLFVGRSMKAVNPPQRIGTIERSTMDIDEIDVFFPRPHALTIHPAGDHIYVASLAENRMATVDFAEEAAELKTIEGPTHTFVQFAVAPDGNTMVVGGQLTGKFMFFDTSTPSAPALTGSIDVGAAPWHPVFAPDGQHVYFGNKMAGTVTAVNIADRSVAGVIKGNGIAQPHGAAISPDGRYLYIASNNLNGAYAPRYNFGDNDKPGTVTVINTATQAIEKVLEVGPNATGLSTAAR